MHTFICIDVCIRREGYRREGEGKTAKCLSRRRTHLRFQVRTFQRVFSSANSNFSDACRESWFFLSFSERYGLRVTLAEYWDSLGSAFPARVDRVLTTV